MSDHDTHATVIMYDHDKPRMETGKILRRYPNAITIDNERNIRCCATFDRVKEWFTPAHSAPVLTAAHQGELFRWPATKQPYCSLSSR